MNIPAKTAASDVTPRLRRNAIITSVGTLLILVSATVFDTVVRGQVSVTLPYTIALAVMCLITAALSFGHRSSWGMHLFLTSLVAYLYRLYIDRPIAGAILFGTVNFIILVGITIQTLPPRQARAWIFLSFAAGVGFLIVDGLLPPRTIVVPYSVTIFSYVLAIGIALGLLIYIAREFRDYSLRTKLSIISVTLTSLAVLIIGAILLVNTSTALRRETEARLKAETQVKASALVTAIEAVRGDIVFVTHLSAVENYARALENRSDPSVVTFNRRQMEVELINFTKQHKSYDQVRYLDINGQEVVRINNSASGPIVTTLSDLQDISDTDYFKNSITLPEDKIYISNLELNKERGLIELPLKPTLRYATPVYLNGRVYGVIIINTLAENFLSPLGSGTSSALLIDADGYYLYHPEPAKRWGREERSGFNLANDYPALLPIATSGISDTYETSDLFFAYSPIRLEGESLARWFVISSLSSELALAPVTTAQRSGLLLLASTLIVAGVVTAFGSQILITPLTNLTHVAERVGAGELNVRARTRAHDVSRTNRFYQQVAGEQVETIHTDDEIDILAGAFNNMANQLQQTLSGLEQRVAERTRDLAIATEVGQRASLIRDLETLLSESVELIRERFNLYYVQIYLLDVSGKTLVLRAGTGEVGKQLLERAHRLAVGTGINGSAAASRQAVIVTDTASSPIFRANPLLPDTRSEMAVPILIGERVLGVLDLQSNMASTLNVENASVFLTLAAQIAIAIENIMLFAQAEEARKETEGRARRLTQEGWEQFLNAVDRSEQIGYTFETDSQSLIPITDATAHSPTQDALSVPITITGQEIGAIHVEGEGERRWTKEEAELIQTVADQVARQIENLRLLTQAEQSRAEAELATRRLTREGWQDFFKNKALAPGYVYDLNQVTPLEDGETATAGAPVISYPLKVGYETIGELKIQSVPDESANELLATVADQLSLHIENLRLAEQTQSALAETQTRLNEIATLNQISQAISAQTDTRALFEAVREKLMQATQSENIYIALYNNETKTFEIPFMFEDGKFLTIPPTPIGHGLTSYIINTRKPLLIRNEEESKALGVLQSSSKSAKSYLGAPMIVGDILIGVLAIQDLDREYRYTLDDLRFLETVASQIAVAVQNTRLFEQTQHALGEAQQRTEQLAVLNEMGRTLTTVREEEAIYQAVHQYTSRLMDTSSFFIAIYDTLNGMLTFPLVYSRKERVHITPRTLAVGPTDYVIRNREPLLLSEEADKQMDARGIRPRKFGSEQTTQSWLGVPLLYGNEVMGAIVVQSVTTPGLYKEFERDVLTSIASQAVIAIENVRSFQETRQRAERESTINVIAQKIQGATSVQGAIQTAIEELGRALKAKRTMVKITPRQDNGK